MFPRSPIRGDPSCVLARGAVSWEVCSMGVLSSAVKGLLMYPTGLGSLFFCTNTTPVQVRETTCQHRTRKTLARRCNIHRFIMFHFSSVRHKLLPSAISSSCATQHYQGGMGWEMDGRGRFSLGRGVIGGFLLNSVALVSARPI